MSRYSSSHADSSDLELRRAQTDVAFTFAAVPPRRPLVDATHGARSVGLDSDTFRAYAIVAMVRLAARPGLGSRGWCVVLTSHGQSCLNSIMTTSSFSCMDEHRQPHNSHDNLPFSCVAVTGDVSAAGGYW